MNTLCKTIRFILLIVGIVFIPFLWIGFLIGGMLSGTNLTISLIELYRDFIRYYKSGQPPRPEGRGLE